MTKPGPSKSASFLNAFYDLEAPEEKKSTARCEIASAAACAIGFYVSFDALKRIWKTRVRLGSIFNDYC
jgi:hypothetical protein